MTSIGFHLRSISCGKLIFEVRISQASVDIYCNDVIDPFVPLVKFARQVPEPGDRLFTISEITAPRASFAIRDADTSEDCRFAVEAEKSPSFGTGGETVRFNVVLKRMELQERFLSLFREIADHPYFAHLWVGFVNSESNVADRVLDDAEKVWKSGVRDGQGEGNLEEQERFEDRYYVKNYPLSAEDKKCAERYRQMLLTLTVPDGWD